MNYSDDRIIQVALDAVLSLKTLKYLPKKCIKLLIAYLDHGEYEIMSLV